MPTSERQENEQQLIGEQAAVGFDADNIEIMEKYLSSRTAFNSLQKDLVRSVT